MSSIAKISGEWAGGAGGVALAHGDGGGGKPTALPARSGPGSGPRHDSFFCRILVWILDSWALNDGDDTDGAEYFPIQASCCFLLFLVVS